jgi:L-ascorbate metabolism protein UlaG (beta-lactamase superfamily)
VSGEPDGPTPRPPSLSAGIRRISWLGHATVLVETGGARLLTDPLLRHRVMHLRRQMPDPADPGRLDGVLLSHVHRDHLDKPSLRRVAGAGVTAVLPVGAAPLLDGLGFGAVCEVRAGGALAVGGAGVRVVPAWHDGRRRPGAPELDALGYVVDGIWFAGDTDLDDRMAELRGAVEVALIPVWGWGPSLGSGHLDPERAARAVALVAPRVAIPIHWGTYFPYGVRPHGQLDEPPARFAAHVAELAPATRVETLSPGSSLSL